MKSVEIKLIVSLLLFIIYYFVRRRGLPSRPVRLNLLLKIGVYLIIYKVLNQSHTADLVAYYIPQGQMALAGQVPHRDFTSAYGALFPYLIGYTFKWFGYDGWYLILILADTCLLSLIMRRENMKEAVISSGIYWFWLLNPLIFWNTLVNGQQQMLIALFGVLAILASVSRCAIWWAPVILCFGALSTKVMAFAYTPAIVMKGKAGLMRGVGTFLLVFAIYLTGQYLLGVHFLDGLRKEGAIVTSGSIFYWIYFFSSGNLSLEVANMISIMIAGACALGVARATKRLGDAAIYDIALTTLLVFFILAPRIYANYYVLSLPLIAIWASSISGHDRFLLASMAMAVAASVEVSLYFALGKPSSIGATRIENVIPLMACDLVLIATVCIMICKIYYERTDHVNSAAT